MDQDLSDAALLLIGHGSTVNTDSAGPVRQHAAALRARRLFAEVHEAFWKQEPGIRPVLASIRAPRIVAVPLFISEGYFTTEVIPRELGLESPRSRGHLTSQGQQTLYYTAPVGTHPSMTNIILARAEEVVQKHPFPRAPKPQQTALCLAGHGTARNDNSRRSVEHQRDLIRAQNRYAEVHAVFMEEAPRIGDCYELSASKFVVVVPFFISDGLHSYEDIPVMLGEAPRLVRERMARGQPSWRNPTEKKDKLVWYARSVGTEPHLADVILERVREALA